LEDRFPQVQRSRGTLSGLLATSSRNMTGKSPIARSGAPLGASPRRGTYSIVARDPNSGELGVAVQSHWFSVGSIVSWAEPGVGAVATQAIADPTYGPRLLARLRAAQGPREALDELLAADEQARFRQVAVVDAAGTVAVHTGDGCIPFAGHVEGESFSAQANMMASEGVWPAMAEAFTAATGALPRRLLAALDAGEAAGGDVRGRQSAALVVVPAEGEAWQRAVELRVEDHHDPLGELRRLLDLADAYAVATEGDDLVGEGRHEEAAERYREAADLAPANGELLFWAGLALAQGGDVDAGAQRVQSAIAMHSGWRDLLARLDPEIAPAAPTVQQALEISEESR
jgi:uncharacterized Ntn-hydrolase superfamily protein